MLSLAVDTSTEYLSVSLLDGEKVIADYHSIGVLKHSSLLVPTIKKALKKGRKKISDIGLICVGLGPGSFTGLRIGVTTMRALAIAIGKPLIGVSTLDAIAYNGREYIEKKANISNGITICPVIDAKKNQVYSCIYGLKNGKLIKRSEYLLAPVTDIIKKLKGEVVFLGDVVSLYKKELTSKKDLKARCIEGDVWFPKARTVAQIGLEKFAAGESDDPYDLVPLYLYARDCNVRKS